MTDARLAQSGPSLMMIELEVVLIATALAFLWPRLGGLFFGRLERALAHFARRKNAAVFAVGCSALLLRLALIPLCPIPTPYIHDDFSELLAADTYASGRLTNPTPPMWEHFESFHITLKPTYMSMYFPAQGLVLAFGKGTLGNPWYGQVLVTALMCAAVCWMLQAWLPPGWALLGGAICVLRLGLFGYWVNSYCGAGSIAALGGALVLGSLPRLMRTRPVPAAQLWHGVPLTLGFIILAASRPYEGLLLGTPVSLALLHWLIKGRYRPTISTVLRWSIAPLLLLVLGGSWMTYYNYRVFGSPWIQPYTVNRQTYAVAPHFLWQQPRPEPVYRHAALRQFYTEWELDAYRKQRTPLGIVLEASRKLIFAVGFYAGFTLLIPLLLLPLALKDRRMRLLTAGVAVLSAGMLAETWMIPHYIAPFTCAFYALGLQSARHLRQWIVDRQPTGQALCRFTVVALIVVSALRAGAGPLHLKLPAWPQSAWLGSPDLGMRRAQVQAELASMPGRQLVIVRYSPTHSPFDEWVYNAADIDGAKVVWAREMDAAHDRALIEYYKGRTVWLVQPDEEIVTPFPYTPPPAPFTGALASGKP